MKMEHSYPAVEFECEIGHDGSLKVPPRVVRTLGRRHVTVRLTAGGVGSELRERRVTEDEIERIALTQYEERDHVIDFLRSEGSLARSAAFSERATRLLGRTQ